MTNVGEAGTIPTGPTPDGQSKPAQVADSATSAASDVASTAAAGAKDAASEAATQAKVVAGEAKRQVGAVVDKTRQELSVQAEDRTRQAAGGLRTLADQVSALADGRPYEAGPLSGYLGDAQSKVTALADRLETGGPQGLIDDVTGFARRRPVVFLAAAIGAGFMAGRLAKAGRAAQQDSADQSYDYATGYTPPAMAYVPPSSELPPPAVIADPPLTVDPTYTGDAGFSTDAPYTAIPGQP